MAKKSPVVDEDGNPVRELSSTMINGRKRSFEAIKKKALLVALERSMFTNFIFDTNVNDLVCSHLKVTDDSLIHVRKCLIHPKHMEKLMNITNDAVMLLWNLTRPWDNNDFRILPMEMYDDFQQTFQKLKDDFEDVRDQFKAKFPDYLKEAKASLGKAFNADDYPKAADLDKIFVLNVITREINDPDDIRLNLTEAELMDLEAEAGEKYAQSTEVIRNQVLETIRGVGDYIATTQTKDKELVKLLGPLASLIGVVNNDNDPSLEQALMEFKDIIAGEFDDINVDKITMSAEEREAKKYENMSEEEMMMDVEDEDGELDTEGLDDW